jgi:hypothetical protein
MTESEWLASSDPKSMLEFLRGRVSDRKLRLFAVGCCRRGWERITVNGIKELVEFAERSAEVRLTERDWLDAFHSHSSCAFTRHVVWPDAWQAASKMSEGWLKISGNSKPRRQARHCVERPAQTALLFDVIGNPFQPWFVFAEWLRWRDATIPKLARAIYEERAFDQLSILADALEDSGCEDTEILAHCRRPGPHVRGCWVVDLILGKQ